MQTITWWVPIARRGATHLLADLQTRSAAVGPRRRATAVASRGRTSRLEAPESLPGFKSWRGLRSIGVVISETQRDGKATDEVRYYISSLAVEPDAKTFAHAVRSHWGVENGCHWTLDVTFREDESRIREKRLRENMAWLNRFCLSLLKQHPARRSCGHETTLLRLERRLPHASRYRINKLVAAGLGVSMPDTQGLQRAFGQPTNRAAGCGFPVAWVLALFHPAPSCSSNSWSRRRDRTRCPASPACIPNSAPATSWPGTTSSAPSPTWHYSRAAGSTASSG